MSLNQERSDDIKKLVLLHLQFAWWSLLCYVILGFTLEALHAYKMDSYLGKASEIRRLLWTLAHAHGTLLSLVHVALAFTLFAMPKPVTQRTRFASSSLIAASILMPTGFFLGGTFIYEGDPGLGIWLVPVGALALIISVVLTAIDLGRPGPNK